MRKDVVDSGPAVTGPDEVVEPGVAKGWGGGGWPSKWLGPGLPDSSLPQETLDLIAGLEGEGVVGLLLPAVQKAAAAENMPFVFYKITEQDSIDALKRIDDSFDDDVVFLNPGGEQRSVEVFLKMGDVKGEVRDEQDVGAWSPLSDFSDSDTILL